MKKFFVNTSLLCSMAAGAVFLSTSGSVLAGIINGGSLLNNTGADQLETWFGSGDLDFTNVYAGVAGDSVRGFHAGADGVGATFSIYEIEFVAGGTSLIGGYTQNDWGVNSSYTTDLTAFIFNLSTLEVQFDQTYPQYATYNNSSYFPTFGGGHDIMGGYYTLGNLDYAYSHTYDLTQGSIAYTGDSGYGIPSGCWTNCFDVTALEVYTFADATSVPEPASVALLGLGLIGLGFSRRKKV